MNDRAVLLSVKPKYCELIASGKKTVEVRKTRPKIPTPFKGLIYCTKGETVYLPRDIFGNESLNGKVIGEFVCDYISMNIKGYNQDGVPAYWTLLNSSCLTADELDDYGRGKPLYGLHISNLKIYDNPKTLDDFRKPCISPEMPYCPLCKVGYEYISETEAEFYRVDGECRTEWRCLNWIKKPPQSWCYAEEIR